MSGTLQASVVKDGASATNNLAMDASGNVTVGNNLTVAGTTTYTGAVGATTFSGAVTCQSTLAVTGTITGSSTVAGATGVLYPLVSGTAQASTSGTSIDFTGIPSWAKRIIVTLNGVSLSGSSDILIQLGTSGGFVNTGYNSVSARISGAGAANTTATNGFNVTGGMAAAANLVYGAITIANHTGNTWVESGVLSATGTAYVLPSGGSIALAAALTQVRITTANGTDTFDAGSVNIQYE